MAFRSFKVVVAATLQLGIGKENRLPWRLPSDMSFFKELTSTSSSRNAVIMGRKTWDSIPMKFRPLPDRLNVVVTRNVANKRSEIGSDSVLVASSLQEGLSMLSEPQISSSIDQVFVIGGGEIYAAAMNLPECQHIYMTEVIEPSFECDAFFPRIDESIFERIVCSDVKTENDIQFRFVQYVRRENRTRDGYGALELITDESKEQPSAFANIEEKQYLDLIQDILSTGSHKGDRTGTGTISKFGLSMRFSLRDGRFPLLTTKSVFWRGVAEELLWFISGSTNARELQDKGIKIWDGNASKPYLASIGLDHREEGDLGPVYGFQWRHFGAQYVDMHTDYRGLGVDQLAQVIDTIKTNPNDRRIILSAWNPADLKLMALPPCHMFCQFYVANGELSCCMYQRSCDMGLGVPFNIASYSLLTCLIAQVCDLKPGEFTHMLGDAHVYQNHVEPLKEQLTREPFPFPSLRINPDVKDIDKFTFSDLTLENYRSHAKITMKMAV